MVAVEAKKSRKNWYKTGSKTKKTNRTENRTTQWADVKDEGDRVKNDAYICGLNA